MRISDWSSDVCSSDLGIFSRDGFTYNHATDTYSCPAGKTLMTTGIVGDSGELRYRASKYDCDACAFKQQCCPKEPARKVPRWIHEGARDMARGIAKTEDSPTSRRQRQKDGMLFAHLTRSEGRRGGQKGVKKY